MPEKKTIFPPINFQLAGKIIIILGLAVLLSQVMASYDIYFKISNYAVAIGIVLIFLGVYVDYAGK